MEKLKYIIMCAFVFGVITCNGPNDKKEDDKTPAATDMIEGSIGENMRGNASDTTDWSKHFDTGMNISILYGDLEMTEQQIKDYETASETYQADWTKKNAGNGVMPSDVQGIFLYRDKSLKSILTEEQYKRYEEMVNKAKNDNN